VMAYNKADLVQDRERLGELMARQEHALAISARTGEGLDDLLRLIVERLEQELVPVEVTLPWSAQDLLPEVHQRGRVLAEQFEETGIALTARVPVDVAQRLKRAAGVVEPEPEPW